MKEKIRVMFYDDGIESTTGYARVAKALTKGLAKDSNFDVYNINITDRNPAKVIDGVVSLPCYGNRLDPIKSGFVSSIVNSISILQPHVFIPICDAFLLERDGLSQIKFNNIKFMPYIPLDSNNLPTGSAPILDKADRILVQSQFAKDELTRYNYNSFVFRHGVEFDKFKENLQLREEGRKEFNIQDDEKVFLFIGRNTKRKRIPRLLRGYAEFIKNNPDHKTKLIMHGSEFDEYNFNLTGLIEEIENQLDVDLYPSIIFPYKNHRLGKGVSDEDIIKLYNVCDWTISMSHGEGCFIKGTKILTEKGFENIEEVQKGTKVQSADGNFNNVLEVSKRPYFQNLISFRPHKHFETIKCTKNHPILIEYNENDNRFKNYKVNETIKTPEGKILRYIRAEHLTTDDFLVIPKIKLQKFVLDDVYIGNYINMRDYELKNNMIYYKTNSSLYKPIKAIIPNNKEFMKILGLYLSEGSLAHRKDKLEGITFSFGTHKESEKILVEELKSAMKKVFGLDTCSERTAERNRYQITFYSRIVADFIYALCGEHSHNKHLPIIWKEFGKKNLEILKLYMNKGDGWYNEKTSQWEYTTVSRKLADDYYNMNLAIGNFPSIKARKGFEAYQILDGKKNFMWKELKDYYLVKIKELTEEKSFFTFVYNLEVENNPSYCVNNYAVHNTGLLSLEGFANRKPTIYPQNSNYKEILDEYINEEIGLRKNGFEVKSFETEFVGINAEQPVSSYMDLAIKLEKVYNLSNEEYNTLQDNVYNWAMENADWKKILDELKIHIREVLRNG